MSDLAQEIVENLLDGDKSLFRQFRARITQACNELSAHNQQKLVQHAASMCDQTQAGVDASRAEVAELHASLLYQQGKELENRIVKLETARTVVAQVATVAASTPAATAASGVIVPTGTRRLLRASPKFSAVEDAFIAEKSRGSNGSIGQTVAQTRATFRLWLELVGDRPVSDYTGTDAGEFRDLLLRFPASHGKGARIDASKAVAEADRRQVASREPVTRLTKTTAKRPFSAMSQLWVYLKPRGHLGDNIFRGFTFPGAKSTRRQRDDWSPEDLSRLPASSWIREGSDTARRWALLIALYGGLRVGRSADCGRRRTSSRSRVCRSSAYRRSRTDRLPSPRRASAWCRCIPR